MITTILLAGFAGGVVRGMVGYTKYASSKIKVNFVFGYFITIVVLSGIIGLAAGWLTTGVNIGIDTTGAELFYAFIAGYAGGDFIENLYKIFTKKMSVFNR